MFLLKLIYKPFVFMFYLLFNFTYAMIKLLAKLVSLEPKSLSFFADGYCW